MLWASSLGPIERFFYNTQSRTLPLPPPPPNTPFGAVVLIQQLFYVVRMAALICRSLLDVR